VAIRILNILRSKKNWPKKALREVTATRPNDTVRGRGEAAVPLLAPLAEI
jgi:hypothetical protein